MFVDGRGGREPFEVESLTFDRNSPILRLRGIATLDGADALAGRDLYVPEEDFPPAREGSFYDFQIIGCEVVARDGSPVGTVRGLLPAGARDLLVVDRDGREVLIPFVESICFEVDAAGRRIRVDLPDGLLDLNEI